MKSFPISPKKSLLLAAAAFLLFSITRLIKLFILKGDLLSALKKLDEVLLEKLFDVLLLLVLLFFFECFSFILVKEKSDDRDKV